MSGSSGSGGCGQSEQISLYVLGTLPMTEQREVERHLATCTACKRELEELQPVLDAFVDWPTDVLRAPRPLWDRVAARISSESGREPLPAMPRQAAEPAWKEVAPGIQCKLLAVDEERNLVSMLVRLAPGTEYPPHRHAAVEELHLLDGILQVDQRTIHPGDYLRSEPATSDARVYSETGCACVLITSLDDELR